MKYIHCILLISSMLIVGGCTDLEEELFDQIAASEFYQTEAELEAGVATVYQHMTNFSFWYTVVMDNASDALTIYTHSGGWNNDRHRRTDTHELRANDNRRFPLNQAWNNIFDGIAKANSAISSIEANAEDGPVKSGFLAEVRALRAWLFFLGMDVYGDMPLVTTPFPDPTNLPSRVSRAQVFEFCEQELLFAIENLPSGLDGNQFPRINQEAARGMLAHLYLNAEVFTRSNAAAPGSGTTRWQDCIAQCQAIRTAQGYALADNYFDLFKVNNDAQAQSEMVFYVDHEPGISGGTVPLIRHSLTQPWINEYFPNLPYNVWNGPAVQMSFWDQYDLDDKRRNEGFLIGVQFTTSGDTLKDPSGNVVNHTREFFLRPDDGPPGYQAIYEGIRPFKFEPDNNAVNADQGNGFPVIRLADILLMEAECLIRLNGPNSEADALINQVRARVFDPAKPLTGATLDDVYWERGFELYGEGHRRRDQIRFDTFHLPDDFHPEHDRNFNIWPIPQDQINANPNLGQNPGY
ncbi:MAG: RagB/SusD family nutrient uptake outer membrane protein [Bacteroidota bacterium]